MDNSDDRMREIAKEEIAKAQERAASIIPVLKASPENLSAISEVYDTVDRILDEILKRPSV